MKRNNFSQLVKEEMVRRFESVVTSEINAYENAQKQLLTLLQNLGKELQALKDEVSIVKAEKDKCINIIGEKYQFEKASLQNQFDDQRHFIKGMLLENKDFISKANEKLSNAVAIDSLNDLLKVINEEIFSLKVQQDYDLKTIHNAIYLIQEQFSKKIEDINFANETKLNQMQKVIDEYRLKTSEYYVSNEGFLRELNSHKRIVFVQEKKIENLYTLIERLQKKV